MGMKGLPTSPEPGGHAGGSRQLGRRGAPGPAMGGFTAAAGTFHHCLRGALWQFKFTLLVAVNSTVSNLTVVHHVRADSLVTLEIIHYFIMTRCRVANEMKSIKSAIWRQCYKMRHALRE